MRLICECGFFRNIYFDYICSDGNAGGVSAEPEKPHQESDVSIHGLEML